MEKHYRTFLDFQTRRMVTRKNSIRRGVEKDISALDVFADELYNYY